MTQPTVGRAFMVGLVRTSRSTTAESYLSRAPPKPLARCEAKPWAIRSKNTNHTGASVIRNKFRGITKGALGNDIEIGHGIFSYAVGLSPYAPGFFLC